MPAGAPSIGRQLFDAGWRQGSFLEATPNSTVNRLDGSKWQTDTLPSDGGLVVASQTCDLVRAPEKEPSVEFVRAYWTDEKSKISEARKNSNRLFLLRTEQRDGMRWGLVADATIRMFVEKRSLLGVSPQDGCSTDNDPKFQRWLARRYDRPAVPDDLDRAVHHPIVNGIRAERLANNAQLLDYLDGIAEVRYEVVSDGPPYEISLFFVPEDPTFHAPAGEAEAEEVAAWMISTLEQAGGARVRDWQLWSLETTSVADYFASTPLSLYEFST